MGVRRRMPVRGLRTKLKAIRIRLNLTQPQMLELLAKYDRRIIKQLNKSNISQYESGRLESPIAVLYCYAKAAGVCMEVLANPRRKLPRKLPVVPPHLP
jgi:transcriptional regulator with XRE-family HTH domain